MKRIFSVIFLLLAFSSCGSPKSNETVFPNKVQSACATSTIQNQFIVQWEDGQYTLEKASSENNFRDNFLRKNLSKIKHVDRDFRIQIKPHSTNARTATNAYRWHIDQVGATAAWSKGYHGENVIVGVIDGYVDTQHPQLKDNITFFKQFNDEINDARVNKHGTHVSGIIAADMDAGPVSGIAPKAKIAAGQFIGNDGAGSIGEAILAMNAVAQHGAKIINLSWGGAPCVENLRDTMMQLSESGVLIVTAAGNESTNSDAVPTYPANFHISNQINVAASGMDDLLTYFSNRGYKSVQLAAPGQSIYSTTPENSVQSMDGTSMAAPVVSGAAALLFGAYPEANAQQVKQALMNSVYIPGQYLQTSSGGRLNVENALSELKRLLLK